MLIFKQLEQATSELSWYQAIPTPSWRSKALAVALSLLCRIIIIISVNGCGQHYLCKTTVGECTIDLATAASWKVQKHFAYDFWVSMCQKGIMPDSLLRGRGREMEQGKSSFSCFHSTAEAECHLSPKRLEAKSDWNI